MESYTPKRGALEKSLPTASAPVNSGMLRQFGRSKALPLIILPAWSGAIFGLALLSSRYPSLASLVAVAGAIVALTWRNPWKRAVQAMFVGLIVFSYGFNNIPLPTPIGAVPLVDAILGACLLVAFRQSGGQHLRGIPPLAWLSLLGVAILRIVVDLETYGVLALRDATFILEATACYVGAHFAYRYGQSGLVRMLDVALGLGVIWGFFYPLRDAIIPISPVVGLDRPVALLSFATSGVVAAAAIVWFSQRQRPWAPVFVLLAIVPLLARQDRMAYVAVAAALVVQVVARRSGAGYQSLRSRPHSWPSRFGLAALIVLGVVGLGQLGLSGRHDSDVSFETVASQMSTLIGQEGVGSGSLDHRLETWSRIFSYAGEHPGSLVVGRGLGTDLFDGATDPNGELIRKPHNDLLEVLARLGLVGLISFVVLVSVLARRAWRSMRQSHSTVAQLSVIAVFGVPLLVQPWLSFAYGTIPLFFLLGASARLGAVQVHGRRYV